MTLNCICQWNSSSAGTEYFFIAITLSSTVTESGSNS